MALKDYIRKYWKRTAIFGSALAAATTIHIFAPKVEYEIYNTIDGIVDSAYKPVLSPEQQKRKMLMETGDKELNELVEAYVDYLDAENNYHLSKSKAKRDYYHFISNAKYEKFKQLDRKNRIGLSYYYMTFQDINNLWEKLGFFYSAEIMRDSADQIVFNVTFGKIIKKDTLEYDKGKNKIKYDAIIFEPIVDSYTDLSGHLLKRGLVFNNKAYMNLKVVKLQCEMLKQWNDALKNKSEKSFEDFMAEEAYSHLMDMARKSGRSFEEEFVEMEKRTVLGIHEPQHFETPNEEYPSILKEIIYAKTPADQSYVLSQIFMHPELFSAEEKEKILKSNFEERKKIVKNKLDEFK